MIIEIRKAGFINKGAELMLLSILEKVRKQYPDCKIAIEPTPEDGTQPYIKIAENRIYLKGGFTFRGVSFHWLFGFLPKKVRSAFGIILEKEIDVILDAAGFAYTDKWGLKMNKDLAKASERWKKKNIPLILLPQALGPFDSVESKEYAKKWIENSSAVFARDEYSMECVLDIAKISNIDQKNIYFNKDFTNIVEGKPDAKYTSLQGKVAIVPNMRMVDMNSNVSIRDYIRYLEVVISKAQSFGHSPFLLVHEGADDYKISKTLNDKFPDVQIIQESCPLKIKSILGSCRYTVSSRFHAIVSSLSQGVPCLGTGWSHKYHALFSDYEFSRYLLEDIKDFEQVDEVLIDFFSDEKYFSKQNALLHVSDKLKAETESMWDQVFQIVDRLKER